AGETSLRVPRLPDAPAGGPRGQAAARPLRPVQRRARGAPRGVADAAGTGVPRDAVCAAQGQPQGSPGRAGQALGPRPAAEPPPRLSDAFAAFFERAGNADRNGGKKPGYPRFKPYSRFRQVRFVNGDGAKWIPADGGGWAHATFQAVGSVKVRQHRQIRGTVK